MRIALMCATQRGYLFLKKLLQLAPDTEIIVFSFREVAWEPPFVDDIRTLAESNGCQFIEARSVASKQLAEFWDSTPIDLLISVSWRYLIPRHIYERAKLGAFVFHDSLLPVYRGFAPTVWAIINGEDHSGVTLFEMAEEVDAGDIVAQRRVPIGEDETIADVMERVTQTYLDLLEENLPNLLTGNAPRTAQDHSLATFTCKWTPEDSEIDWAQSTERIYNLIRASTKPYPGAFTTFKGQKLTIWKAERVSDTRPYVSQVPGRVVEIYPGKGTMVLTGDGRIMLTEAQLGNGEVVCADAILKSVNDTLGRESR